MYQSKQQQLEATGHLPTKPANDINFDKAWEALKLLSVLPTLKDCKQHTRTPCGTRALEEDSPIWIINHRTVFWSMQLLLNF